jgi:S1-C subfamily serine protease
MAAVLLGSPLSLFGQPRNEALFRVFSIKYGNTTGTAFFVEVDNRQYLITAKHVVSTLGDGGAIQLLKPDTLTWTDYKIQHVLGCEPADIVVLAPVEALVPNLKNSPVLLGTEGLILGGEVYFLGFPFGFDAQASVETTGKYLLPFVKHAHLSALVRESGAEVLYLDGYNNLGFSGGPVVWFDQQANKARIVGVISAYRNEPRSVRLGTAPTPMVVDSNAGIILAYSIAPAIEAIQKNPAGPRLQ